MGWLITRSLWNTQIAQYGRDASEVVLYYPPVGYAAATACFALLLSVSMFVRRQDTGKHAIGRGRIAADPSHTTIKRGCTHAIWHRGANLIHRPS